DLYDAVIYATGAPCPRTIGIPGEQLPGSLASTQFVGWYNGQPRYSELEVDLTPSRAIVVGNGNVALDIARVLLLGYDGLHTTDIANHALSALESCAIEEVLVLGRRGPAQASFTPQEIRELDSLPDTDVRVEWPLHTQVFDVAEAPKSRREAFEL